MNAPETARKNRTGKRWFDWLNKRTHLYSSMFFLPWMVMYALSALPYNHPEWFRPGPPAIKTLVDRGYDAGPLPSKEDTAPFAEKILAETGLKGPYLAAGFRGPAVFQVNLASFWRSTQIIYDSEKHTLVARARNKRPVDVLMDLHTRGGFGRRPGFLQVVWSVFLDIVLLALLIWIVSGLYIWWHLKRLRTWGWIALGAGFAVFGLFMLGL